MIAEALSLFKTAVEGAVGAAGKVAILDIAKDPRKYVVVGTDGKFEIKDAAPVPRKHSLGSIDQVPDFVEFAVATLKGKPTVWYEEDGVIVVVTDDATSQRIDHATATLTTTDTFDVVSNIGERWLPQKAFVRLLRITLADAATDESRQLLKVCRVLAFSSTAGGRGSVELGRQSLGRDIEDEVRSEVGDLPEAITLNVRLFDDPSLTRKFEIPCAVDIDPAAGTFNLCPLPGSIEDALDEQLAQIGATLEGAVKCPVFRGRP